LLEFAAKGKGKLILIAAGVNSLHHARRSKTLVSTGWYGKKRLLLLNLLENV
jgi:hypothetical protein